MRIRELLRTGSRYDGYPVGNPAVDGRRKLYNKVSRDFRRGLMALRTQRLAEIMTESSRMRKVV